MFKRFLPAPSPAVPPSPQTPCRPSIENVLDACLEDILIHGKSIEGSLQEHPSCADELRPLLLVALGLTDIPRVSPSSTFKRNTRRQLLGISEKDAGSALRRALHLRGNRK